MKRNYLESFIVFSIPIKSLPYLSPGKSTHVHWHIYVAIYTYWAGGLIIHNLVSRLNFPLPTQTGLLIICFKNIFQHPILTIQFQSKNY